jgi:hypothetical protein
VSASTEEMGVAAAAFDAVKAPALMTRAAVVVVATTMALW